jgi:hypothetical protein
MTCAGERPENHDERESEARAQRVCQLAARGVHQCVREKESGGKIGELFVRKRNVFADSLKRNGDRLAVEIADRDSRADEYRDAPPKQAGSLREPAQLSERDYNSRCLRATLALLCLVGRISCRRLTGPRSGSRLRPYIVYSGRNSFFASRMRVRGASL